MGFNFIKSGSPWHHTYTHTSTYLWLIYYDAVHNNARFQTLLWYKISLLLRNLSFWRVRLIEYVLHGLFQKKRDRNGTKTSQFLHFRHFLCRFIGVWRLSGGFHEFQRIKPISKCIIMFRINQWSMIIMLKGLRDPIVRLVSVCWALEIANHHPCIKCIINLK